MFKTLHFLSEMFGSLSVHSLNTDLLQIFGIVPGQLFRICNKKYKVVQKRVCKGPKHGSRAAGASGGS